jgi:hypothetical protein
MRLDAAKFEGADMVLGDLGGKRFAIGIEPDGTPLLCCLDRDKEALSSVSWTSAAMIFNQKDRDFIVLSCKDVRVRGSAEMNAVPVRLWVPLTLGRLDPWKDHKPEKLSLGTMKAGKKGALATSGTAFANVSMKIIG